MIQEAIKKLVERKDLERGEAEETMSELMSGTATPAQIGSFITALRMKGETVEEITACAGIMRKFAERIEPEVKGTLVDTCGTGGDCAHTFNISTTSMFVIAGQGIPIAKHGNRSVSSQCGSADVLEELGLDLTLSPKKVEESIEQVGVGFMFAPAFHNAMKYAIGPRKEIGIRTIFNILGPLTNPANAQAQLLGVFRPELTNVIANVLGNLGVKHAMVVHGLDGLDEISTLGKTIVSELKEGKVKKYELKPEEFGIERANLDDIGGGDKIHGAKDLVGVLKGTPGPKRDIVLLNSAAGIVVGGKAKNLKDGITLAAQSIDDELALGKLREFIGFCGNTKKLEVYL